MGHKDNMSPIFPCKVNELSICNGHCNTGNNLELDLSLNGLAFSYIHFDIDIGYGMYLYMEYFRLVMNCVLNHFSFIINDEMLFRSTMTVSVMFSFNSFRVFLKCRHTLYYYCANI